MRDNVGGEMKKFTLFSIIAVIVFASAFVIANATDNYSKFSSGFKKNFKDCDKYEETVNSEYEGKNFTTKRSILGWRNGFCRYEETISSKDGAYKLSCAFSNVQVDELYLAMKSRSKELTKHDLETFVETTDPKTGKPKYVKANVLTIKGDKAYIAWAKYQNNPYFCKPEKIK